jgi:hypothetical protein
VGGEAGERLEELFDTVDSSGRLSNEEINRIIAEYTGAGGRSGLPAKTRGRARGFNEKRISTIHHYLLGQADNEEIGGAYRDADGPFERISTAMDLPPLFG